MDREEFYRDILEGLSIYFDSPFVRDILAAVTRHPDAALGNALNKNQIACKLWLAESLRASAGTAFGDVTLLGGWYGVLAAVLLNDPQLSLARVTSVDIDPACAPVAQTLNATHARAGRFQACTADMLELDYAPAAGRAEAGAPDLLINTSCEHIARFGDWYARVPDGQLLVLQSNDYVAIREHVNCVTDLAAFRAQAPMREVLFAGAREQRRYRRFMLIGRK